MDDDLEPGWKSAFRFAIFDVVEIVESDCTAPGSVGVVLGLSPVEDVADERMYAVALLNEAETSTVDGKDVFMIGEVQLRATGRGVERSTIYGG